MVEDSLRGPFFGRSFADVTAMIAEQGAEAVVRATLDAIDRAQPALNAFLHIDRDAALDTARRLDAEPAPVGPLHGVPVGIKDLMDVAGWPMTCGSKLHADRRAGTDCEGVARLRAAGAIPVASTVTHEFAYGPTADATAYGPVHNPHDLTRMTGGSSGGSGAAVAAGVLPITLGTDTGGSIRIPAALCGTVGLKATHGAVPTDGVFPLAPSLDHLGPLTIDVDAARAAFEVMSGTTVDEPDAVSWSWLDVSSVPCCDEQAVRLAREAVAGVAGSEIATLPMPDFAAMRATGHAVMAREAFLGHEAWLDDRRADYIPEVWDRFDAGRTVSDADYRAARADMDRLREVIVEQLPENGVVVSPTIAITAPPIGERETIVGGQSGSTRLIITNLTILWNVTGLPTVSVPIGYVDGLPVGLQITGRPGSEGAVLAAARSVERRTS